jgi:hypothetical protein
MPVDAFGDRGHNLAYKRLPNFIFSAVEQIARVIQAILLNVHARVVRVKRGRVGIGALWLEEAHDAETLTHVASREDAGAAVLGGGVVPCVLRAVAHGTEPIVVLAWINMDS